MTKKPFSASRRFYKAEIPHEQGNITCVGYKRKHFDYSLNSCAEPLVSCRGQEDAKREIESLGLRCPTASEVISLVHASLAREELRGLYVSLNGSWVHCFNSLFYTDKGVYIEDNPSVENYNNLIDHEGKEPELIKRIESGDKSVRFVPFGFETGGMSMYRLGENDFVRSLIGKGGVEKLAEIEECHRKRLREVGINDHSMNTVIHPLFINSYSLDKGNRPAYLPKLGHAYLDIPLGRVFTDHPTILGVCDKPFLDYLKNVQPCGNRTKGLAFGVLQE